ncbi:MAG: hypothetical protein FWD31_11475 [Planctomycetaceae bacterium]|nr:hypothetical protein [Planctomycetaceae bacterium]
MQTARPYLASLKSDAAYEALTKWESVGVLCQLDETGVGVVVNNVAWHTPETGASPVPSEALEELGQHHDEILSHLRYWKRMREIIERIWTKHGQESPETGD